MDFKKLKVKELIEYCKSNQIRNYSNKNKNELISHIMNYKINQEKIENTNCKILNSVSIKELEINNLKYIDLFSGIGGFHQALKELNCECVLACDIDKKCREIYELNYQLKPYEDIKKIDEKNMPKFDILCGGFPCFVSGTPVLTYNGYKNIEDITLDDTLLTHQNKFQKILNKQYKIYNGTLYDIKLKYHPNIIHTTKEHPFFVRECVKIWNNDKRKYDILFKNPVWKEAHLLTMNDFFGMVINDKNIIPEFSFEKKINQYSYDKINIKLDKMEYWYMMGYLIGNGWIEETKKSDGRLCHKIKYSININNQIKVLDKIRKVIPITDKKCSTSLKCNKYGCNDYLWYNILKQFGKYAPNKIIPEWIQDSPKEFIEEFINGYIDSDGCVIDNGNKISITTTSINLAYGIQRLLLKLGHIFSVNKYVRPNNTIIEGRVVNQNNTYKIYGVLNKIREGKTFIEDNYVWYEPNNIENREVINEPVYNFEVESDNTYIVDNICVHNCQPFSNGGNKKSFNDDRGLLFDEIIRIASYNKPKFMFLENVKHILKVSDGKVIDYIKDKIKSIGYELQLFNMSPHNYGIPQQRERIFFVCIRNDIYNLNPNKIELYSKNFELKVDDIISNDLSELELQKYQCEPDILNVLNIWDILIKQFEVGEVISPTILINDYFRNYSIDEFNKLQPWRKDYMNKNKKLIDKYIHIIKPWYDEYKHILSKREIYGKLEWQTGKIKENDSIFNYFIQIRQSGIRVKKTNYFPTLVAISQIPIYGKLKRYITPRECARLQSFPNDFIIDSNDKVTYKQMGNSVNVYNTFTIINSTFKHYNLSYKIL